MINIMKAQIWHPSQFQKCHLSEQITKISPKTILWLKVLNDYYLIIVCGWILSSTSLSASLSNSEAKTVTEVVPSPTSSSCTFDNSTKILAAGLSTPQDLRIVAPSLVTWTL